MSVSYAPAHGQVDKIAELRKKFLDKYSGNIIDDTYDERDVDWVKKDDSFMRAVLASYNCKGDVAKGVDMLNGVLTFRAKMKINDLKESDLNQVLRERDGVYFKGKDKQGLDILMFKVGRNKKGQLLEEAKQYIAYYINLKYKQNPEAAIVLLFDMHDAGISNMDNDVTKFVIQCTSQYFPSSFGYSLMFKMGTALEAVFKIIKGFMDPEQSKKTYFVKRSNIQEYIAADQLEPHMIKE